MTTSSLLDGLNDSQRDAVTHEGGPLMIVAGAGTGKTRVITRRVAHLIEQGIPETGICAITFTNKAAREMAGRIRELLPGSGVWISTFHSLGARLLRIDGPAVGVPRDFTICDRDDQVSLVRRLLSNRGINAREMRPEAVLSLISLWKNQGQRPGSVVSHDPFEAVAVEVYVDYARSLQNSHQLDFDDLLLCSRDLVVGEGGERWRRRYDHVLVDEYQDTNGIQCELSRALASATRNLSVCGDPDQSIYSWRGADVRNILDFQEQYPDACLVRLEQNYRSTGSILDTASSLIAHNRHRVERGLYTDGERGPRPVLFQAYSESGEAEEVARRMLDLHSEEALAFTDMAVLYRTNALSRAFEVAFGQYGVPYRVIGAIEFYARKEVRDLLAFLRLKVNPSDAQSFLRLVNTPSRGIGPASQKLLLEAAEEQGASLIEVVVNPDRRPKLRGAAARGIQDLARLLQWLVERGTEGFADILQELVVLLGYREYLESAYGVAAADGRMENVGALIADALDFEAQNPGASLAQYLEQRALVQDTDNLDGNTDAGVALMTLHSAKGLEFDVVFLVGLEHNLLPHRRSTEDRSIEEERRLLYVGITRARRRLFLSHASQRFLFGRHEPTMPSPFLAEIPRELLDGGQDEFDFPGPGTDDGTYLVMEGDDEQPFQVGDAVQHDTFGVGQVLEVIYAGRPRLRIRFQAGDKTIVPDYTQLRKVQQYDF